MGGEVGNLDMKPTWSPFIPDPFLFHRASWVGLMDYFGLLLQYLREQSFPCRLAVINSRRWYSEAIASQIFLRYSCARKHASIFFLVYRPCPTAGIIWNDSTCQQILLESCIQFEVCDKCFCSVPLVLTPPPNILPHPNLSSLAQRAACGLSRKKYFIALPCGLPGPRPPACQGVSYSTQIIWVIRVGLEPTFQGETTCHFA